jgi:hypothetical protein
VERLFKFAEQVIDRLRIICPALVVHQVLRIDLFGFSAYPGEYIVNEIEGYEAQRAGRGIGGGDVEHQLISLMTTYWFNTLVQIIECFLSRADTTTIS